MEEKLAGDSPKDKIDWRQHHSLQPYAGGKYQYEDFVPAYSMAQAAFSTHRGKTFEEIENELALDYKKHDPLSALPWDEARPAVRSAWDKLGGVITAGDRDRGIRSGF
jgi:hypothetical protein